MIGVRRTQDRIFSLVFFFGPYNFLARMELSGGHGVHHHPEQYITFCGRCGGLTFRHLHLCAVIVVIVAPLALLVARTRRYEEHEEPDNPHDAAYVQPPVVLRLGLLLALPLSYLFQP